MTLLNRSIFCLILAITTLVWPGHTLAADPSLEFDPSTINHALNEPFTVSVMVNTAGYASGGVGTIINYDPFMISATAIQTGQIFTDYPMSSINNQRGKITISGIAASPDHLFSGTGEFARITFKPNQLGHSDITFSFEPGSTTDSNIAVTFGSGDILTKVNQLTINTIPATSTSPTGENEFLAYLKSLTFASLKEQIDVKLSTLNFPFISSKYASARRGRPVSKNLDPLTPIVAQTPITDNQTTQPPVSLAHITTRSTDYLPYFLITSATLGLIILAYFVAKNSSRNLD